jgi:hypothetical protein
LRRRVRGWLHRYHKPLGREEGIVTILYIVAAILVAVIWLVTWAACRAAALSDRAAEEIPRADARKEPDA